MPAASAFHVGTQAFTSKMERAAVSLPLFRPPKVTLETGGQWAHPDPPCVGTGWAHALTEGANVPAPNFLFWQNPWHLQVNLGP